MNSVALFRQIVKDAGITQIYPHQIPSTHQHYSEFGKQDALRRLVDSSILFSTIPNCIATTFRIGSCVVAIPAIDLEWWDQEKVRLIPDDCAIVRTENGGHVFRPRLCFSDVQLWEENAVLCKDIVSQGGFAPLQAMIDATSFSELQSIARSFADKVGHCGDENKEVYVVDLRHLAHSLLSNCLPHGSIRTQSYFRLEERYPGELQVVQMGNFETSDWCPGVS